MSKICSNCSNLCNEDIIEEECLNSIDQKDVIIRNNEPILCKLVVYIFCCNECRNHFFCVDDDDDENDISFEDI